MLTQGKVRQLGSPPRSPSVKIKYTNRRVAKSWKLLPRWEKRGCFQQGKIGLAESYFGNLPQTADMPGSPGQGLDLGPAVSAPEQRLRQRILPRVLWARNEAAGMGRRRPQDSHGENRESTRISNSPQLPNVSWREWTAPKSNQIKRYSWEEWQGEGRQSSCFFKVASAKC